MVGIVRLALRLPYTPIVLAVLITIFGSLAAVRTPTDIFPDTDPQAGLAAWWNSRKAETPGFAAIKGTLAETLAGLAAAGTALVVVNTPPILGDAIAATMAQADLVVIPVRRAHMICGPLARRWSWPGALAVRWCSSSTAPEPLA